MWIEPLYDSSSLLGIIPILLCIWFANLPGTMIPSSHIIPSSHEAMAEHKQRTYLRNHLPWIIIVLIPMIISWWYPHDIPILDGYLKKSSSSEIHLKQVWPLWPSDCRWQAYFINAKGWKRWSTNTSRAMWNDVDSLRAKILRFPPKTSPTCWFTIR